MKTILLSASLAFLAIVRVQAQLVVPHTCPTNITAGVIEELTHVGGPLRLLPNQPCEYKYSSWGYAGQVGYVDIDADRKGADFLKGKTFTPEIIASINKYMYSRCDPPSTLEGFPVLWCSSRGGDYGLILIRNNAISQISYQTWPQNDITTKASTFELAKIAFFNQPPPALTAQYGKRFVPHVRHPLKSGMWQMMEVSSGEGISWLDNGASAYAACVQDGAPQLQNIFPETIKGCIALGEQVSASVEKIELGCESANFEMTITYTDPEHYHAEVYQEDLLPGIDKPSQTRVGGRRNYTLAARWKETDCGALRGLDRPMMVK